MPRYVTKALRDQVKKRRRERATVQVHLNRGGLLTADERIRLTELSIFVEDETAPNT